MSKSSLSLYWELASTDASIRSKAVESLIQALQKFQSDHSSSDALIVNSSDLEKQLAPDVSYGLKRLLRGLPSSRDGARQGFSVALSEVL